MPDAPARGDSRLNGFFFYGGRHTVTYYGSSGGIGFKRPFGRSARRRAQQSKRSRVALFGGLGGKFAAVVQTLQGRPAPKVAFDRGIARVVYAKCSSG